MRKSMTFVFAVAAIAAFTGTASAQGPTKIGYVDSRVILRDAPGAAEVTQTLQKELTSWRAQLAASEDSIKTMVTDFEKQSLVMSPDAKQKKQADILARQNSFQARYEELQQKATERQKELLTPIMDRVQAAITELRTAEGYAIIFDSATEAMVAADPTLDLTQKVLARLKAPGATASGN